tara:strand:- start:193 stop:1389 length:1197 start_codon:yes stop_codon:yes gene_type:complete
MKCILHIGTEKTGTTILQDWLYTNSQNLSDNGVYLSDLMGKTNNRLLVCYFMDNFDNWFLANSISSQEEKNEFFKDFKHNIIKEVKKAEKSHEYMIITSEHFHSRLRKPELISQLREFLYELFDEVKVVCYFREQSAVRTSLYSTALKAGSDKTLEEFHHNVDPSHYYHNYFEIASRWSDIFGIDNCIFRIYDRKLFANSDLRYDFLSAVGLDSISKELDFNISSANESLTFIEGVLYRLINELTPLFLPQGGVNAKNRALKQLISSQKALKEGKIVADSSQEIYQRFEECNKEFFNKFFDGKFLFNQVKKTYTTDSETKLPLEQVATMLEELFRALSNTRDLRLLENKDADILRDVALKYENGDPINKEEARKLMMLANRARPHGGLIKRKLKEYSS